MQSALNGMTLTSAQAWFMSGVIVGSPVWFWLGLRKGRKRVAEFFDDEHDEQS